jgi:hypothetical protein
MSAFWVGVIFSLVCTAVALGVLLWWSGRQRNGDA